jgi:putative acetyltransferase
MVILIGGASHVGKTLMAQKLLEIYKIPYLSIDHLKMGLYRSGSDYGFEPESDDEIITQKLWPIIKGIIMTNIENDQNIIIEGCYLPKTIEELDNEYLCKIMYLYIIFSENYIRKNLMEKIQENRNIIEKRGYDFEEFGYMDVEKYISENKNNKENCIKNGIKCIEINEDYGKEMEKIYKWIGDEIKKLYNGVRPNIA